MRKVVSIAITAVLASSCMGDGFLEVRGKVRGHAAESGLCSLTLQDFQGTELEEYYSRTIQDEFHVVFSVEPKVRKYKLAIFCEGRLVHFQNITFHEGRVVHIEGIDGG